jgi:hypothetical protein
MNTLGLGPHNSFTSYPPKLRWTISLVYDYFEDFQGNSLSDHCLPDVYMLCHRSTLYLLVDMILFMKKIHIVLSCGYDLIDDMDPPCILLWPWSYISCHGSAMYYLAAML